MGAINSDLRMFYPASEGASDGDALDVLAVDSATATTIVDSELTQADDYWNGAIFKGLTGDIAGVIAHILDFAASSDTLTFPFEFSTTPGVGDTYSLILSKADAYRSSTEISGKTIAGLSNVTGFTIEYCSWGNADTTGAKIKFSYNGGSGQGLSWSTDGTNYGTEIDISGLSENDVVTLTDNNDRSAFLRVKRSAASLPTSDKTDTMTISSPKNLIIPTCSGSETTAGRTHYAQVFLHNYNSTYAIPAIKAYIKPRVATAAETTIAAGGNIVSDADDVLTATSLANWPTSGWVYHKTGGVIDDIRFYWSKSGNVINVLDPDGGMRDFTAGAWAEGDTIGLYSDIDIAITALSSDQFPDPSGLSYSSPLAVADALSIGDLAAGVSYGLAIREYVPAGQWPRADLLSYIALNYQVAA